MACARLPLILSGVGLGSLEFGSEMSANKRFLMEKAASHGSHDHQIGPAIPLTQHAEECPVDPPGQFHYIHQLCIMLQNLHYHKR